MRVDVTATAPERVKADAILGTFALPLRRDRLPLAGFLRPGAERLLVRAAGAFTWLEGHGTAAPRVVLASLGAAEDRGPAYGWAGEPGEETRHQHALGRARRLGAGTEHACHEQGVARLVVAPLPDDLDPAAFVEALLVRAYGNTEFQPTVEPSTLRRVTICVAPERLAETRARIRDAVCRAEAVNLARSITDLPANVGSGEEIVRRVRPHAKEAGLSVSVAGPEEIRAHGMGLLAAVARASRYPAQILTLEHRPPGTEEDAPLVFLGKGVLHDTGGYSLKRAEVMHRFTDDKAGAAAVVGALVAIARLGLPVRVIGMAPLVENAIGPAGFKPGDVLTSMNGTTVFVESTDAEGRLVLADCLSWIEELVPRAVVDLATLTDAAVVALGNAFAALFANDDALREHVAAAGRDSGDLVWPMPIHPDHDAAVEHHHAELRNVGPREAGASVAAAFLRRFVDYPWAHVDMAGLGSSLVNRELVGAGATGWGTRLLVEVARRIAEEST